MPALHTSVVGVVEGLSDSEIEDRFGRLIEEFIAAIPADPLLLVEIVEESPEPDAPPRIIVPRLCAVCGAPVPNKTARLYCSWECREQARRQACRYQEVNAPRWREGSAARCQRPTQPRST